MTCIYFVSKHDWFEKMGAKTSCFLYRFTFVKLDTSYTVFGDMVVATFAMYVVDDKSTDE